MDKDLHRNPDYESARLRMVDEQLRRRGIHDVAVLAAMSSVPRHLFVHADDRDYAYGDHPLSIGHDQTISQPFVVASMTQELQLDRKARVFEVGTGCGYQTAVLAEIVEHVYTVECLPELLSEAVKRLDDLGYSNITSMQGDGSLGWAAHAPFDGILVAAAAASIPPALVDQLADPGRMVIPLGEHLFSQELVLVEKREGNISKRGLYGVRFVPLRTLDTE